MQNGPQHHLSDQKMTLIDITNLTSVGETATLSNCDLQGLDLSQSNMSGWNFEKCNLTRTSFNGANLENAIFLGCRAPGASFLSALLTEAQIEGGDYSNCHFRGATLVATKVTGC
jgi:fluoroquinolone resistance protein